MLEKHLKDRPQAQRNENGEDVYCKLSQRQQQSRKTLQNIFESEYSYNQPWSHCGQVQRRLETEEQIVIIFLFSRTRKSQSSFDDSLTLLTIFCHKGLWINTWPIFRPTLQAVFKRLNWLNKYFPKTPPPKRTPLSRRVQSSTGENLQTALNCLQ